MIWEGGRDRDQGEPGIVSDMACLAFCMLNAALWPLLIWLLVAR